MSGILDAYCIVCGAVVTGERRITCSVECGKENNRRRGFEKYRQKAGLSMTGEKKCRHCGTEFKPENHRKQFCSDECLRKRRAEKDRAQRIEYRLTVPRKKPGRKKGSAVGKYPQKACEICGELFKPDRSSARYCGKACSNIAVGERNRQRYHDDPEFRERNEAKRKERVAKSGKVSKYKCRQCGSEFTPENASERLCSPECKAERKAEKDAARKTTDVLDDENWTKYGSFNPKTPPPRCARCGVVVGKSPHCYQEDCQEENGGVSRAHLYFAECEMDGIKSGALRDVV